MAGSKSNWLVKSGAGQELAREEGAASEPASQWTRSADKRTPDGSRHANVSAHSRSDNWLDGLPD